MSGGAELRLALRSPLPGAVLRLVPAALVVLCVAVVGGGSVVWTVGVGLAVATVVRPRLPVAPVLTVLVGLWLLAGPDLLADDVLRLAGLVLALHLLLATTALAVHVGWRTQVEAAVLGRVLVPVVRAQAAVQALLLVAWWVQGQGDAPWVRTLGVVAAVAAVLLLLPSVRRVVRG